jgi:superfamily II DNA or RNA helicase
VVLANNIEIHLFKDLVQVDCWTPVQRPVTLPAWNDPTTREYQVDAISACISDEPRGQIILPTGAGKTTIQAEAAIQHASTLVWVPSIALVRQSARAFLKQDPTLPVLAVVSSLQKDSNGLPLQHTTSAADITAFRAANPRHVVLATYQSADAVVAAGGTWDMAIYDEAHRTAGSHLTKNTPLFKRCLNVQAAKYRFFTATPRVHSAQAKGLAASVGAVSYSMDNPAIYGDRLFTLPIKTLVEQGHLVPFDIVVAMVSKDDVLRSIEDNGWTDFYDPNDLDKVRDLAMSLAVADTMYRWFLTKGLTFHTTIEKARKAAEQLSTMLALRKMPVDTLWASGDNAESRDEALLKLDTSTASVVANAKLFGEGVDVPSLEFIAFYDPKSSKIDITQCIGRAIRPSDGKGRALVILPVFVEDPEDAASALSSSNYRTIYSVAAALRDQGLVVQVDEAADPANVQVISRFVRSTTGLTRVAWDEAAFRTSIRAIMLQESSCTDLAQAEADRLGWTLIKAESWDRVHVSCAGGHQTVRTLQQLRLAKRVYCQDCVKDMIESELHRLGWTLDEYRTSKDFTAICPNGHTRNDLQHVNVTKAQSRLQCDECFIEEAHDLAARSAWTVVEFRDTQSIDIACPEGHTRTTTIMALRRSPSRMCLPCSEKAVRDEVTQMGGWKVIAFANTKDIDLECDNGHQKKVTRFQIVSSLKPGATGLKCRPCY